MEINFFKYQGTGNDFIMIDCVSNPLTITSDMVQKLCDRRFGIGADGLIGIFNHESLDFEMKYFNSDGSRSFCGNGARCAVAFAHQLGLFDKTARFNAIDGIHEATWNGEKAALQMQNVSTIGRDGKAYVIQTGSPHYISFVDDLEDHDIISFGKKIRYDDKYQKEGINVNLVQTISDNAISMLTYERGVEDETYSCGTGATAAALAHLHQLGGNSEATIKVKVKGGDLAVKAIPDNGGFTSIYLIGPATFVFHGSISI